MTNHSRLRENWTQPGIAIALLLMSAGIVTGGIWLSLQLFINPNALSWANPLLPKWAQILAIESDAQTLAQIRVSIQQQGKILGEPIALDRDNKSLLVPILQQQQIIELRLYQTTKQPSSETYYQLADRVTVAGLDPTLAIAPLVESEVTETNNPDRPLPFTQLHQFIDNPPSSGKWLYLSGEKQQGNMAIAYGQIVYYDPDSAALSLLLTWTSPNSKIPQWQQITGNNTSELVIDATLDLEPQFRIYQVSTADSQAIQLEEISLLEPTSDNRNYRQALILARNGLWSPALQYLQIAKQDKKSWSSATQAQMDLIQLHAQFTSKQAEQTWASPSQQILVNLIDGRWEPALQVLQSAENSQEIAAMLQADKGQLWNRVEAALSVNPDAEVQTWGALILAAGSGRKQAIAWLHQQTHTYNSQDIDNFLSQIERSQENW